jgi:hypothetical protein
MQTASTLVSPLISFSVITHFLNFQNESSLIAKIDLLFTRVLHPNKLILHGFNLHLLHLLLHFQHFHLLLVHFCDYFSNSTNFKFLKFFVKYIFIRNGRSMQVNRVVLEPGFKSRIESSHVILVKLVVFESAERGLGSFSPCDRSHLLRCLRLSQAEFNPLAADFKPDSIDGFVSDQLHVWRRWIRLIR